LAQSSPLNYAWKYVGDAGISAGEADYTSLAFNPSDGEPYISYCDGNHNWRLTILRFDGTKWVNVGNAGFSGTNAYYPSLAFSSAGVPYVAYSKGPNTLRATVMKFDGTNWVYVGNASFSAGEADYTSLAFNHQRSRTHHSKDHPAQNNSGYIQPAARHLRGEANQQ